MTRRAKNAPTNSDVLHSRIGGLVIMAAAVGVHPGPNGGLRELRKLYDAAAQRAPYCPKCGPWQRKVRQVLTARVWRCRACGYKLTRDDVAAQIAERKAREEKEAAERAVVAGNPPRVLTTTPGVGNVDTVEESTSTASTAPAPESPAAPQDTRSTDSTED